jgi:5-methylcytosine-specific restriction enzyme subunit McrC
VTALLLISQAEVEKEYKEDLKKKLLFFSHVDALEPLSIRWSSIRFTRNNQAYRMLISICQLIIEGMLLTTERGEYRLASFIDEQRMSRLYERFILEYFIKEHPELRARASQIPWALDDATRTMLPKMQSDITLSFSGKALVIDAKYYTRTTQVQHDAHTIHSANIYQIFSYVKNMDASYSDVYHEVSGLLLYARTEDAISPDVSYQMSGNRISVKTLDLNCEFSEIAEQLNIIGDSLTTDRLNAAV